MFHLMQILKYLKVVQEFGKIINLSYMVLGKVLYFIVFYMLWIVILACLYGILGNTLDKDDDHPHDGEEYERMTRFTKLFLFALRNSVGDIVLPDHSYWSLYVLPNEKDAKLADDGHA